MHLAKLTECERLAEERVRDPAVLHLVPEPPERIGDDQAVIERESGHFVRLEPLDVVTDACSLRLLGSDEGPVHDRDDARAG